MTRSRYGLLEGRGYRREYFDDCPDCTAGQTPQGVCSKCGGYGEIPNMRQRQDPPRRSPDTSTEDLVAGAVLGALIFGG